MLADDLRIRVKGTLEDALDKGWNEDEWTNAVLLVFADCLREQADQEPRIEGLAVGREWAMREFAERIEEASRG